MREKTKTKLTLEVGHVGPDIRVKRIHYHLPIGRACDLDPSVDEAGGGRGSLPGIVFTDVLRLGQEIGEMALVDLGLSGFTPTEEVLAGVVEGPVQEGEKDDGITGQDLGPGGVGDVAEDADAVEDLFRGSHGGGGDRWG